MGKLKEPSVHVHARQKAAIVMGLDSMQLAYYAKDALRMVRGKNVRWQLPPPDVVVVAVKNDDFVPVLHEAVFINDLEEEDTEFLAETPVALLEVVELGWMDNGCTAGVECDCGTGHVESTLVKFVLNPSSYVLEFDGEDEDDPAKPHRPRW